MTRKYPDVSDSDFYEEITRTFSRYKIPKKKKTFRQICYPKKYEFQLPQQFLGAFMNPKTPYKGVLVFHRIGAGKTCASIRVAESFKNVRRIVVVLPASLKGNYRAELRTPCAGNAYLTNAERAELRRLDPASKEYKAIIKRSDTRIDRYYTIYSYNKFTDLIKTGDMDLSNTLLIIDEVHNMISETGIYYELLHGVIHSAPDDLRLLIMTATPIFDKPMEIALTMNLIIRDRQLPTGLEFVSTFMNIEETPKGPIYHTKNMDEFKNYIKGYVSYYQGAPSYAYPKSVTHFVRTKMSDFQNKLYRRVLNLESNLPVSKLDDYVNNDISNSFFIGTRTISNIVFPNRRIGQEGFDSLRDSDLTMANIGKYSPKFRKIIRKIKKCEGTVFVYSSFKEFGGIRSFVRLLEHHHFKNYEYHGSGLKRYAIWSGDQDVYLKDEIKAVFNNPENADGSRIKVILGSPAIKEGVSLFRIQEVHLIEPYWNFSRMEQIIGRAIRFCSHKDMPSDKQLVNVYIYMAFYPGTISVDEYIMKIALQKRQIKKSFERALMEAAVDCKLFEHGNATEGESIKCDT